ncbi:hypothetical protein [Bacillus mycoides]|uniref:hypothetical protein n=1 Tax=Bacillus mycoides TaxID=1405 RepID=UPI0011A1C00D|nr:hypothetical protein [Bacillus mycoides]
MNGNEVENRRIDIRNRTREVFRKNRGNNKLSIMVEIGIIIDWLVGKSLATFPERGGVIVAGI